MAKKSDPTPNCTCDDCFHCQACHLWSNGAISPTVATKCPKFEPTRYATLKELQDLYRMTNGEVAKVVHGRWEKVQVWKDNPQTTLRCSLCKTNQPIYEHDEWKYCPFCGQPMDATDNNVGHKDGGEPDGNPH